MKTFAKPIIIIITATLLLITSFSLFGQQDCNIYDSLMVYNYDLLTDPGSCCQEVVGTYADLYYDVEELGIPQSCGACDTSTNPYKLEYLAYPGGAWSGSEVFCSYTDLAGIVNDILEDSLIDESFHPYTNGIYAEDADTTFGILKICADSSCISPSPLNSNPPYLITSTSQSNCYYTVYPEFQTWDITEDCDSLIMPPLDPDSLGENASTPENMTLIEIPGEDDFMTNDITQGGPLSDTIDGSAPSPNAIGYLFNTIAATGVIQNGASCTNLNCFDLTGLADSLDSGEMAATINENLDTTSESYPSQYNSWSEFVSAEVALALDSINLVDLLNDNFGFNIPNLPCDTIINLPGLTGGGSSSFRGKAGQRGFGSFQPPPDPKTNADLNYFGSVIPGLGLDGPGAATPSPTAMSMIENIKGGVNLYNGSQSTSIPLYTVLANDIAIPISLSSSNNGLKVNDVGSIVGQNWDLNAGGSISRVVKGLPDEYDGTVYGIGRGRIYKLTPLFEFPANIGLDVQFSFLTKLPCINIKPQILNGFSKNVYTSPDARIQIDLAWTPIRGNKINCTLLIRIFSYPTGTGLVSVFLKVGFDIGINASEVLGDIEYEEQGKGFFHLDDQPFGIASLTQASLDGLSENEKKEILNKVHPNRRFEDAKFFSDQIANWDAWIEALTDNHKYKTKKLDTQPDEFYFNVGGYSGRFSYNMDDDQPPVIFPYQKGLAITKYASSGGDISGFKIRTPDGKSYIFGDTLGSSFTAVDFTDNTNYYLPNFYTYPETGENRDKFLEAEIDVAQLSYFPFFGKRVIATYGNSYDRNYKKMEAPRFSSSWHLVQVNSLLTEEEVELIYDKDTLTYYSDKSYSHTFPNFDVEINQLETDENEDLNPRLVVLLGSKNTKWENGRAEFAYSATQTELVRWDLKEIKTDRGESAHFMYGTPRGEIDGDYLCDSIAITRGSGNSLFKGWKFSYGTETASGGGTCICNDVVPDSQGVQTIMPGDTRFFLGDKYRPKHHEYHNYLHITFSLYCLVVPIRLNFGYAANVMDWGYTSQLAEFGSIADVKRRLHEFDDDQKAKEEAIYNAEHKRSFLIGIEEVDKTGALHDDFVHISYNEGTPPKRFSLDQDLMGYYNRNTTGSPLPPIKYISINGDTITSQTKGIKKLFGFYNDQYENDFYKGHDYSADFSLAQIGALSSLKYGTGAEIAYTYESNTLPFEGTEIQGAGIRVASLKEDPFDMPAKVTYYYYYDGLQEQNAFVINDPIRIEQDVYNFYYDSLEQRIVCSSAPVNSMFSNKNNHVGYKKVMEYWKQFGGQGAMIGRKIHHFTTPEDYGQIIQDTVLNTIDYRIYKEHKEGIASPGSTFGYTLGGDLPPSLQFPEEMDYISEFMGLEYKTEVYDVSDLIQQTDNTFQYFGTDGCSCPIQTVDGDPPSQRGNGRMSCPPLGLTYFQTGSYQYNFPGTFWENYNNRVIPHYRIFSEDGFNAIDLLLEFLETLLFFDFDAIDHPYKYIDRNTWVSQRCVNSGNVRMTQSIVQNFFENGSKNKVKTDYVYNGNNGYLPSIPDSIKTATFTQDSIDQGKIEVRNIFALQNPSFYDASAITHLNDIGYKIPLYSKTSQSGTLIETGFTALTMDDGKVVPKANFTARSGQITITGAFEDYNDDGKPQKYFLAKHGTAETGYNTGSTTQFFDSISLSWNNQLQITSRKYLDFETSYKYDQTYYVLTEVTDPDTILTTYAYDNRWRVDSTSTLNGRQVIDYEYNIAEGDNYVKSILSFNDNAFPDQVSTQLSDGFGRVIKTTRDNDGAVLSSTEYDNLFRISRTSSLGKGTTEYTYDHSPITRKTVAVDAVGNKTTTINTGDGSYFAKTEVTDPNGHTLTTWSDGLQRVKKRKSGEPDGITYYTYNELNLLDTIINPDDELYLYSYNDIDRVATKKIPGADTLFYWWDKAYRPVATQDGAGNKQVMTYDDYNRLTKVYERTGAITQSSAQAVDEGAITGHNLLLENTYVSNHTWLKKTKETILVNGGYDGEKITTYSGFDDIGRPATIDVDYPEGDFFSALTYVDAGLITRDSNTFTGAENYNYSRNYDFDDILRPTKTTIDFDGETQRINELFYNGADQVIKKYLGGSGAAPLQKVDYRYDAIGRLTHINSPAEFECYQDVRICDLEITLVIPGNQRSSANPDCRFLSAIEIDGDTFNLSSVIDLYNNPNDLQTVLEDALDALGFFGQVSIDVTPGGPGPGGSVSIHVLISDTNAEEVILHYQDCTTTTELDATTCCENQVDSTLVQDSLSLDYVDLYYQYIEYTGLDINRIEIGSDCNGGFLRNDYTYDADHRVDTMTNTLFNPDPISNVYSTTYAYSPAGNIKSLTRNGLISIDTAGVPTYGQIDKLFYTYNTTIASQLKKVVDSTENVQAQPKGFYPTDSNYEYDANGNVTSDDGKGLDQIDYNLLNLPMYMVNNTTGEKMFFEYTYGAEKTKKTAMVLDSTQLDTTIRFYIGGFEFLDDEPEAFNIGDGRIVLTDSTPRFQFRIADHLGNTVVYFEDKDLSGAISTNIPTDPDSAEVLQRNLYYPFGMQLEGTWDPLTDPRADYLYNGKELEEELGLNWLSYGARMYDPAIARFPSVDPIADQFAWVSPFNYAENEPISSIDLWGLQRPGLRQTQLRAVNSENVALTVVYRRGQEVRIHPNPNYNWNNPSALSFPYVEKDNTLDLPSPHAVLSSSDSRKMSGAPDDQVVNFFNEVVSENIQAELDRKSHGIDDIDLENIYERALSGGFLTSYEWEILNDINNRGRSRAHSSSRALQEIYEVYDKNSGEIVYIGLGEVGLNRPETSLNNARKHPLTAGRNLNVRVPETVSGRGNGYKRENQRIKSFVKENGTKPLLQGILYSTK